MKMSEAILEGIKKDGKQVRGKLFAYDPYDGDKIIGCCALGAAVIGAGKDPNGYFSLPLMFPDAFTRKVKCPAKVICNHRSKANYIVAHLNDAHRWKRETIAKWLAKNGL